MYCVVNGIRVFAPIRPIQGVTRVHRAGRVSGSNVNIRWSQEKQRLTPWRMEPFLPSLLHVLLCLALWVT